MTIKSTLKTLKRDRSRARRRKLRTELLEDRRLLTVFFLEDFEDASITYTPTPVDAIADLPNDYHGIVDYSAPSISFTNSQGNSAYQVQDMNGAAPVSGTSQVILEWDDINISGHTGLDLQFFAGVAGNWDSTDDVQLSYRLNNSGTFVTIFSAASLGNATNASPALDTNFDGIGDSALTTNVMTQYTVPIPDGNTLDIRLQIDQFNSGGEGFAFDDLAIDGAVANNPPAFVSIERQVPPSQFTNADSLVFRATFSEDVQNVDVSDFDVTGASASVTGVTAVNPSTYDLTVSGGNLANFNGTVGIDLDPGQNIEDIGGAPLPNTEPSVDETFSVDNTAPSVTSFTRFDPAGTPTAEDFLTFRAQFSESVSNVSPGDFATNGTTASVTAVVPVSTSLYEVTIGGGDLGTLNGVVGLDLSGGQNITDFAGNALGNAEPGTDETYTMDNVGAPVSILFEDFEDAVLTYTPSPADAIGDVAGNDYYGRLLYSAPNITFANPQGQSAYQVQDMDGAAPSGTSSVTLDWDDINIAGFTNLDLSYFVGASGLWDSTDDVVLSYRLNNTGSFISLFAAASDGNNTNGAPRIDTNGDGAGDGAVLTSTMTEFNNSIPDGNVIDIRLQIDSFNAGGESFAFDSLDLVGDVIDNPPALLSFERLTPPAQFTNADSLVFRATFSEDVQNVDASDFDVDGSTATVSGVNQINAATYDLTVSGGDLASLNANVDLDLAGGQNIEDLGNNALPAVEPTIDEFFTVDNTAPSILSFERFNPAGSPTSEDVLTFRATFSEAVSGVSPGDFQPNGTTAGVTAVVPVSTSVYDVTIGGGDLGVLNGIVGLDLTPGQNVSDFAGNDLTQAEPATDETYTLDNVGVPVSILFEDFEDNVLTYTPTPADSIGDLAASDYYGRVGFANLPSSINYSNQLGQSFFGAHDMDGAIVPASTVQLNWSNIDISNFTNLDLSWFFAEDDASAGEDWDASDSVIFEMQLDGGGFTPFFAIEAEANATNQRPRVDTDFDGIGDGQEITDTFSQFSITIPDADTLDLRLTISNLNAGDEDIAFDNLSLVGDLGAQVESVVYFNENASSEANLRTDGTGQRSIIRQVEVTFDGLVSVPTGPVTNDSFVVESTDPGTLGTKVGLNVVSSQVVGGKQVVLLNFTGTTLIEDSSEGVPPTLPMLEDGNFRLTVDGGLLGIDANGFDAGVDFVDDFFRIYGTADDDSDVDLFDFARYRDHFANGTRMAVFDFNDNNIADLFDFAQFRGRFLQSV